MQAVFVCGGRGTRLRPMCVGPKSLLSLGGATLLTRLVPYIGGLHCSKKPPVVIVDSQDHETPDALGQMLPGARVVRQRQPDGVANALLLAQPFLDDVVVVTLGDLFLDGAFAAMPRAPGLVFWRDAAPAETTKNFGITISPDGLVSGVIEKPADPRGLSCGMGVYVLTRSVLARFRRAPIDPVTGERGITGALHAAIEAGVTFRAIPFSGYYNNVNSHADVRAVEHHLAHPVH